MRKIILSQPGCSKCKSLSALCPDAEVIELPLESLLAFARQLSIKSLPIVIMTGEVEELAQKIKEQK